MQQAHADRDSLNGSKLCCPLGKKSQLTLVDAKTLLAECVCEDPGQCLKVLPFAGTFYCRALLKTVSSHDRLHRRKGPH